MNSLIDTHAHLDFPQFESDLDQVIERAVTAGVCSIINAGTSETNSRRVVALSERYAPLWAAVGVHPHFVEKVSPGFPELLESLAENPKVVAIGETGLDFYRNLSSPEVQEQVFREHIRLAYRVDKPLIIHSRSAGDATLRVLQEEKLPSRKGIMHCFSGDRRDLRNFIKLGFYLSVAGPVTYPRSHALRELIKEVPRERLLLETDCPYLSPQAYRGLRNEPAFIKVTYERVALLLNIEITALARQIRENVLRLFPELAPNITD